MEKRINKKSKAADFAARLACLTLALIVVMTGMFTGFGSNTTR